MGMVKPNLWKYRSYKQELRVLHVHMDVEIDTRSKAISLGISSWLANKTSEKIMLQWCH